MPVTFRKRNAVADSENALRDTMWPHAPDALWDRKEFGGFITVPKTMPFVCRMLDEMSKNHPLGSTYEALWAFTWDNNAFVRLNRPRDVAYAAGFTGQRGERTLYDRLRRLEELGFIESKPSATSRYGFIFIPNPHAVIMKLWEKQKASTGNVLLSEASYNAFLQRAHEVGCQDVKRMLEDKIIWTARTEQAGTTMSIENAATPAEPLKDDSRGARVRRRRLRRAERKKLDANPDTAA